MGSTADANKRLIEAAPTLLDALKWMVDCCDPDGDGELNYKDIAHAVSRAKEAIAKATKQE